MTVGRRYTNSSVSRYYLKIYSRFTAMSVPANVEKMENAKNVDLIGASVAGYNVSANWLSGFVPYSELRYKVLPILARNGINRSMAYIFMSCAQHAYKELVAKHISSVDNITDSCVRMVIGEAGQQNIWGDKLNNALQSIADILAMIGFPGTVYTPMGGFTSVNATT